MSDSAKRTNRIKIVGSLGMRVRVQKPGETEEQMEAWRARILKSGHPSLVLPSQAAMDQFISLQKEGEAKEKRRRAYLRVVDEVMRKYEAGELVERPKEPAHA